jgi:hypothetical protein
MTTSALEDPRFQLTRSGRFRERFGPAGPSATLSPKTSSPKKVCLVATDAAFLIDLLYGVSLRPDCGYVKYGMVLRDGMVLGRCCMATDRAAALLCAALKGHPRLLVTLQDDDSFNSFRSRDEAVGVWDELDDDDIAAVERVNLAAFGRRSRTALRNPRLVASIHNEFAHIDVFRTAVSAGRTGKARRVAPGACPFRTPSFAGDRIDLRRLRANLETGTTAGAVRLLAANLLWNANRRAHERSRHTWRSRSAGQVRSVGAPHHAIGPDPERHSRRGLASDRQGRGRRQDHRSARKRLRVG